MKKAIIQFAKKLKIARELATYDLLSLIGSCQGFRLVTFLARVAVHKNQASLCDRLNLWLNQNQDPFVLAAVDELTARPDLTGSDYLFIRRQETFSSSGLFCFQTAAADVQRQFWLHLAREAAIIWPALQDHRQIFSKRLDSLTDMRFYGSDLESLAEETSYFEEACPLTVEWSRTTHDQLWVKAPDEAVIARRLSVAAQRHLLNLTIGLLIERRVFVSSFRGVLCDREDRVNFLAFDYLYPFDSILLSFLQSHLAGQRQPQTHLQFKLTRLIRLLQCYCPDFMVEREILAAISGLSFSSGDEPDSQAELLAQYIRRGIADQTSPLSKANPAALAELLDKNRFKRDPIFKKSSVLYYLPLLVLVWILLKYFSN